MNNKKISIVLTTYNGEKYLEEQLESLRTQTRKPDEVIILDDKSSDNTVSVVEGFILKNRLNDTWRLIKNDVNQGWKKNFKKGFDLANGCYIFPCDQDDIWYSDKIEKMVDCMNNHEEIQVLASNYSIFYTGKDSQSYSYESREKSMVNDGKVHIFGITPKWCYIQRPGCTFCFRKSFFEKIKKDWEDVYAHDAVLWRYACMENGLGILNEALIHFRRHGDNATSISTLQKEARLDTFNSYIHFHEIALKKCENKEDRIILNKGILFLQKRKELISGKRIHLWFELGVFFRKYYLSVSGWMIDLYLTLRNI